MIKRIKNSLVYRIGRLKAEANKAYKLLILRVFYRLRIMDAEKTIAYIKEKNCSIARYGDGEFDLMLREDDLRFQRHNPDLARRLSEIMANKNEKLLLCVPWSFNYLKYRNKKSKDFWINWAVTNDRQKTIVKEIRKRAGKSYLFGDAQITRPYIAMKTAQRADLIFPLLFDLWRGRDVLVVEGRHTCLGVGNDLLENAKSVSRILAPATDAFFCYEEILATVVEHWHGQLVILALGPTATVLAADLAQRDIQALDIGHIDVEYEWYVRGVNDRIALPGKFTNEVSTGNCVDDCIDLEYLEQIIVKVGCE